MKESEKSKDELDNLIYGCYSLQKIYGKEPEQIKKIIPLFHQVLGSWDAEKVLSSVKCWLQNSREFPTPYDIIAIMRNGRIPIPESMYVSANKKDPFNRTQDDWDIINIFENQEKQKTINSGSNEREKYDLDENIRLRTRIKELESEVERLGDLVTLHRT